MVLEFLKSFFMWGAIINYGILILWFGLLTFARGWFRKMQGRWFPMSEENFVLCHYLLYGGFKLVILVFNFVPFLALSIVS
ncbi:DUF6868 family protein [Bdellovibrio sp. HCB337]|uniref:DUF6868 family protein n=1 Tax=Bdellovibrio sp. HCB337 TaxID=3394358 RepID=UPI0039A741B9